MAGNPVVKAAEKAIEMVRDPAVRQRALELARKGASYVIPTDDANLVQAVRKGPGPASVVLGGFARAGVDPEMFFEDIIEVERDQASARILQALRVTFASTVANFDKTAPIKSVSTVEERLQAQEVLAFAGRVFGRSPERILGAHALLRAFLGMSTDVLQNELAVNRRLFN